MEHINNLVRSSKKKWQLSKNRYTYLLKNLPIQIKVLNKLSKDIKFMLNKQMSLGNNKKITIKIFPTS
jgi:hypothetical protein